MRSTTKQLKGGLMAKKKASKKKSKKSMKKC